MSAVLGAIAFAVWLSSAFAVWLSSAFALGVELARQSWWRIERVEIRGRFVFGEVLDVHTASRVTLRLLWTKHRRVVVYMLPDGWSWLDGRHRVRVLSAPLWMRVTRAEEEARRRNEAAGVLPVARGVWR